MGSMGHGELRSALCYPMQSDAFFACGRRQSESSDETKAAFGMVPIQVPPFGRP